MLTMSFQAIFLATFQILLMALVGFLLVRARLVREDGLDLLASLLVKVFLPQLIFYKLTQHFDFQQVKYWWAFPLLSLTITLTGALIARILLQFNPGCPQRRHFMALVAFQNAGYIPLILVSSLFMGAELATLSVYIFLFIMGFDLGTWSLGVWLLTSHREAQVQWRRLLNPPFLTTISTLILIALGWHRYVPLTVLRPVKMFGDCALPMAMIVVGGNLALTKLQAVNRKDIVLLLLAKLVLLPLLALVAVKALHLGYVLGFFLVLEAAVPSAVTLSMMGRYYKVESRLINQGIFWDSVVSVITIPVFLSLYGRLANPF